MKSSHKVVKRAVLTEKSAALREQNKYCFEVDRRARKPEIKSAIEELFQVDVIEVKTMSMRGKIKRMGRFEGKRKDWKKAIVTLAEGNSIDLLTQA
jgi:large subunit ribosomal protein L23